MSRGSIVRAVLDLVPEDTPVGLVICSLLVLGYATSDDVPGQPHYYVYRQAIYAAIGLVLMYGASRIDYSRLRELRYPIYGLMIALLLLVLGIAGLAPFEGFLHQRDVLDTLGFDRPESACKALMP